MAERITTTQDNVLTAIEKKIDDNMNGLNSKLEKKLDDTLTDLGKGSQERLYPHDVPVIMSQTDSKIYTATEALSAITEGRCLPAVKSYPACKRRR